MSPQHICRCSPHPRRPKCSELKSQSVFINASLFEIPRRFFSERILISSSLSASAALGLLPFPSFLSCLFLASRHSVTHSKATSSMMLTGYLHSFKCRLKLENRPQRLKGSKSLPSFRFTLRINLQRYSFNSLASVSLGFLCSCFSLRNSMSSFTLSFS